MAETTLPTPAPAVRMETMVERLRRRARLVLALRLAVLGFFVGGGGVGVGAGPFFSFFFCPPAGIREKIIALFPNGTLLWPLLKKVLGEVFLAGAGVLIGAGVG